MPAPRTRYYAFVSRFVDAVVTNALSQELTRLRRARLQAAAVLRMTAPTVTDTRQAA